MFIACTNDYPFAVLNVETEEEARKICDELQASFDGRKKTGCFMGRVYVHLKEVPIISKTEEVIFGQWDNEWPKFRKGGAANV